MAGKDGTGQYRINLLSLLQSNTRWTSRGRPRPSSARMRAVQGGQPGATTSGYIACTVTCTKPLWSSTRARYPTLSMISVTCLYHVRKYWQYTSSPQYERGGRKGGQPGATTSGCIACTVTCKKTLWSSTRARYPTLSMLSVTCLYHVRKYRQYTSSPQYERGGQR